MERKPLKLGILGAGMIATFDHGVIPNLKYIPDKVEPVAVADPVVEKAEEASKRFGIPHVFASLDEMLEKVDLDAVVNLTPIPVHGETSRKIVEAGKHLATEKPIATTMEDADAIIEIAASRGVTVVCSPPDMLYPHYREVRRLVQEGTIGKVAFARVRSSHGGPGSSWWPGDPSWFYQKGSGPLFDMGVYGIHEITGILGPATRVFAFSGITEPYRIVRGGPFAGKQIEVTADDNTLIMLDFGQSTFAFVDATFNVNAAKSPKVEILGRQGTIQIADHRAIREGAPPVEVFRTDAVPGLGGWIVPESWGLQMEGERQNRLGRAILVDHLVDCVWEGKKPVLSAEHARHALEIMIKCLESARQGKVLDLTTSF